MESAKLCALRADVPTCLMCSRDHVLTYPACLCAQILTSLAFFRDQVPTCLACLRAHV